MQLPELATPAPNAALSLAWFQGVRAGSAAGGAAPPPPPRELQAAQEDDSGMLFSETAAGGIAPSASPQPAAAAAAEAALVGKRHTADFAAATPRAAARVAAVAKPNASGVTVAQSRGAAAQAAAASPVLGLPPLEAVVAKRSAVTAAAAGPAAPDVAAAAAAPAADAASAAAAVPRALAQQQPQQPASPAITKVPQLGRQLQQLTVTGQPPPLPPLAAAAAALPSPPHQQEYAHSRPPSLREHHTYSRQSSCGSWQAASMSPKVSALPSPLTAARPPPPPPPYPRPAEAQHRLPPMPPPPPPLAAYQYLHRALPPEGAEEFHRMVALQVQSCGLSLQTPWVLPSRSGDVVRCQHHLDILPRALVTCRATHCSQPGTMPTGSRTHCSAGIGLSANSCALLQRATQSKTPLRCGCHPQADTDHLTAEAVLGLKHTNSVCALACCELSREMDSCRRAWHGGSTPPPRRASAATRRLRALPGRRLATQCLLLCTPPGAPP